MQVINYANRIELVPVKKIKSMRGFLKGIDTTVIREVLSMNLVDSCAWLEYLAEGPNATFCSRP